MLPRSNLAAAKRRRTGRQNTEASSAEADRSICSQVAETIDQSIGPTRRASFTYTKDLDDLIRHLEAIRSVLASKQTSGRRACMELPASVLIKAQHHVDTPNPCAARIHRNRHPTPSSTPLPTHRGWQPRLHRLRLRYSGTAGLTFIDSASDTRGLALCHQTTNNNSLRISAAHEQLSHFHILFLQF